MSTSYNKETKAEVTHQEMKHTEAVAESEGGDSNITQQAVDKESLTLWQCLKKYKYASFICVLASIGSLSDGYQVQMSGSIIALPGFIAQFGALQKSGKYVIDPQYISLWGSLKNVFAMLGAGIGSYPTDKIGRKWMILVVQIIMVGACILEQFSTKWTHWLGARFLDGLSIGLAQCCINVYIGEMAPTQIRGALMSLMQLMYAIGSFLSAVSLNIVNQEKPERWRNAVLSQFALCGVAIIAWYFIPESARWHLKHGREDECKKILLKINGKVEGYDVEHEMKKLRIELENAKVTASIHGGGTYWDVFRGVNRRRLIISFLPWHWQVAIGVPIIGTYSSYFFKMAGLANPFHGTLATNCVTISMLLLAVPLVERLGRRTLLLWCSPICIASLLVMGGVLRAGGPAVGPVLIAFACIWTVGFNLSCGPMGYVYVAETATTRLRAKTTGVAIVFIQGMATVYVYIAPHMLNSPALGMSNTVFFWSGTGALVYILVWFLVPETKGRTFAELDELFERKIPAWRFKETKVETVTVRRETEQTNNV
ncbi:Nn.00g060080.m01.CDS01 [Neocucurbitaria sp. VM-36]